MRQRPPVLNEHLSDLESLPQPIVAYGRELEAGEILPFHKHRRAQLVYASQGVMTVTTRSKSFVVPPERAVWMPAQEEHSIEARSKVAMRTLYINPEAFNNPYKTPSVLQITPLLRELIISVVAAGPDYEPDSPQARMMAVILDQVSLLSEVSLALPTPHDDRLLRIVRSLMENPGDQRRLEEWSKVVGASKRTINRLFSKQTGMTFSSWRQQRRLHRAIELLASGESVTVIALEVGYESTSAFIEMFKQNLGTTPSRYFSAQRKQQD